MNALETQVSALLSEGFTMPKILAICSPAERRRLGAGAVGVTRRVPPHVFVSPQPRQAAARVRQSRTHVALIKICRAYDSRLIGGPVRGDATMFSELRFLPSKSSVPVVINHDVDREVGRVHEIFVMEWPEGSEMRRWNVARCSLIDPLPGWLRRGTGASFSHRRLHTHSLNGWDHVTSAFVDEVTLVGPDFEPVEPLAEVLLLRRDAPGARSGTLVRPAVVYLDVDRDRDESVTNVLQVDRPDSRAR